MGRVLGILPRTAWEAAPTMAAIGVIDTTVAKGPGLWTVTASLANRSRRDSRQVVPSLPNDLGRIALI